MTRQRTILLIDDDVDLRSTLAEEFQATGDFKTLEAGSIAEGLASAQSNRPDLVLFDVHLPDGDGRVGCASLRTQGFTGPIVMLTGTDGEADTVQGLESGANDYVTKPFRFAVLLARVRAHVRSHEATDQANLTIGPYEFRPAMRLLVDANGKKIRLTDKESGILRHLFKAGRVSVSREELLREVWGYNSGVTTHTLETHVYRLRQKIEPDASRARLLITEPGGYRLDA
jgi:DNA-binding response OmpR family regulator